MWFVSLMACIEHKPPVRAAAPVPLDVVVVLESFDRPEVAAAPAPVSARFAAEAAARNLAAEVSDPDPAFAEVRSTDARLQRLGDGAHLLVECAPRFSAQVNGRYRWTVDVTATIEPPRASRAFTVPVHLLYAHEDEEEALTEAAPVIARQVGEMLDAWVEGARE